MTIVIDAVDECSTQKRVDLFQALDRIVKESASVVKVLLSSRDDVDIADRMASHEQIIISQDRNLEDIVRFAKFKLSEAVETKRLLGGNVCSGLRNRILGRLVAGSQGMSVTGQVLVFQRSKLTRAGSCGWSTKYIISPIVNA